MRAGSNTMDFWQAVTDIECYPDKSSEEIV